MIAGAAVLAIAASANAQTTIPGAAIRRDSMRGQKNTSAQSPAAPAPAPAAAGRSAQPSTPAAPSRLGIAGTARKDAAVARGLTAAAPAIMRRPAPPSAGAPAAPADDPWGGRLMLDRYGHVYAVPGREVPVALVDPKVLASGDNVAVAKMLRPAIDYGYLSTYDRFMLGDLWGCGRASCPQSDPTPYAFAPDGYSAGDPSRAGILDPFVRSGNSPVLQAQAPAPDDPEADLTQFEKAGNRLYDGNPEAAVVLLRSYTAANPDDAEAVRALALALIDARRTKDGVELMGLVYAQSPALASSALPADAVGPVPELRTLVVRVVEHAHKLNTPAAWLTVAALMQAEGRLEPALKMLDRADAVNLSPDVSSAMRAALKPRG